MGTTPFVQYLDFFKHKLYTEEFRNTKWSKNLEKVFFELSTIKVVSLGYLERWPNMNYVNI